MQEYDYGIDMRCNGEIIVNEQNINTGELNTYVHPESFIEDDLEQFSKGIQYNTCLVKED